MKSRNIPLVRLGGPPSREYKQSIAKKANPLPSPMERKINVLLFTYLLGPFEKLKRYLQSEKSKARFSD